MQGPVVQRRSEDRTGRHLLGAANGRKLFLKIHVKIQIVISYVFACNKNKALQLQRVPVLSILGLWLRPVRLCWYYANFASGPVYSEY